METILNFFSQFFGGMVDRGEITPMQQFFMYLFTALTFIAVWKIKSIVEFIRAIKEAELENYQHQLKEYGLPPDLQRILKREIARLVSYRLCGLRDTTLQVLVLKICVKHDVRPIFFKKFKGILKVADGKVIFEKGLAFWFAKILTIVLVLLYLMIGVLFITLSLYQGEALATWRHIFLWGISVIMFVIGLAFYNSFPTISECCTMQSLLDGQ